MDDIDDDDSTGRDGIVVVVVDELSVVVVPVALFELLFVNTTDWIVNARRTPTIPAATGSLSFPLTNGNCFSRTIFDRDGKF